MSEGQVHLSVDAGMATVTFDRESARNAMTWAMYEQLLAACRTIAAQPGLRVLVFRGAGGKAFVAGTDIGQFTQFQGGADGVEYEHRIDECIRVIESLPMPTVAVVQGWAVGGGLVLATACDFRIGTYAARFAAPIAATVGNTLSIQNLARLRNAWGDRAVRRMLLLAETIDAEHALDCGFLHKLCEASLLDAELAELTARLCRLAPLTQASVKEALRRAAFDHLPDGDDLVRAVYGSSDFREGVNAFMNKRSPEWTGR